MSSNRNIEQIFQVLDQSSTYIAQEWNKNYIEALIDTAEQIFLDDFVIDPSEDQAQQLKQWYDQFEVSTYTKDDIRRGFQLATLKGMKEFALPGTGMTPDAIVMFLGFLAQKFCPKPDHIIDLALGSGNLLTGVLNQYDREIQATGTEVDPTLVRLAYVNAKLQQHEVEIFHQDGLKPLYTSAASLTVCDLPVGLYPNQKVGKGYKLYRDEGEVYTHHLFIEQALKMTSPGGYIILLIPNTLFTEDGSDHLRHFVSEEAYIQALLQLPQNLFQEGSIYKSIFILQKKGEDITKPKQTLLSELPSFSDQSKFVEILHKINQWIEVEKGDRNEQNTSDQLR